MYYSNHVSWSHFLQKKKDTESGRWPTLALRLPLALTGLTAVFEMGTGGPLSQKAPRFYVLLRRRNVMKRIRIYETVFVFFCGTKEKHNFVFSQCFRSISTPRLQILLSVHLVPINVLVSDRSQLKGNLWNDFALRCFQRLSVPNLDTRLCPWQDNRYTRGSCIPVLSY